MQRRSLPLTRLEEPQVTRRALEALTRRLDGTRAAANTITRKRAVFYNALGYAVELGLHRRGAGSIPASLRIRLAANAPVAPDWLSRPSPAPVLN